MKQELEHEKIATFWLPNKLLSNIETEAVMWPSEPGKSVILHKAYFKNTYLKMGSCNIRRLKSGKPNIVYSKHR